METSGVGMGDMILAATRNQDHDNDGMYGGCWWIIILVLIMCGGWGWGNNRNANGEAVTESGLCNAMNFNNLENAVGRLSDQNQNQTAQIEASIASLAKENALSQANLAAQIADCCCTTQRNIDSVNYNLATDTAAINAHTTEQTQKILDTLCRDRMADMQAKINQLEQQLANVGNIKYPMQFAYSAGSNPFCGSSCGTTF